MLRYVLFGFFLGEGPRSSSVICFNLALHFALSFFSLYTFLKPIRATKLKFDGGSCLSMVTSRTNHTRTRMLITNLDLSQYRRIVSSSLETTVTIVLTDISGVSFRKRM